MTILSTDPILFKGPASDEEIDELHTRLNRIDFEHSNTALLVTTKYKKNKPIEMRYDIHEYAMVGDIVFSEPDGDLTVRITDNTPVGGMNLTFERTCQDEISVNIIRELDTDSPYQNGDIKDMISCIISTRHNPDLIPMAWEFVKNNSEPIGTYVLEALQEAH